MKQLFFLSLISVILFSCNNSASDNNNTIDKAPVCYTDTFTYVNRKSPFDTTKFYGFTDLDSAIAYAKKYKKNILLIFTGWACVSDPSVRGCNILRLYGDNNFIQENFVITCLYVDDKHLLADTTQVEMVGERPFHIRTVGDKNSLLQINLLQSNCQPTLCFVDTNMVRYGELGHYTPIKEEVEKFILSGLKNNK
jgi:hypothetical protein